MQKNYAEFCIMQNYAFSGSIAVVVMYLFQKLVALADIRG